MFDFSTSWEKKFRLFENNFSKCRKTKYVVEKKQFSWSRENTSKKFRLIQNGIIFCVEFQVNVSSEFIDAFRKHGFSSYEICFRLVLFWWFLRRVNVSHVFKCWIIRSSQFATYTYVKSGITNGAYQAFEVILEILVDKKNIR